MAGDGISDSTGFHHAHFCAIVTLVEWKRITGMNGAGDHPSPSRFTLWLTGLGITHELAGSAQENGCAERFHRTRDGRVPEG